MRPTRFHAFRPRLLSALQGYDRSRLAADLGAGLTVGIVALPLALAFGIASGVKPEQGLITAIVAGFLISALGGSQVQIGGPAGAFIVIVYSIVERYGFTNLLVATVLAGVLMFVLGWLKLGVLIRYIPVAIVIGFTNGIAVLIALSQLRDLLGLPIAKMPGDFFSQLAVLTSHLSGFNPAAFGIGVACVAGLAAWPRLFARGKGKVLPDSVLESRALRTAARMPAPIVALVSLSVLAWLLKLPVETIGSRFGALPQGLPQLDWPPLSWEGARQLTIPIVTIAMLGAIESLLCARVADNLAPHFKRHDPNQELMAQGVANVVAPFFGGIPATGTIARTVTNVRAGAATPVAGIVHAATLLLVLLVAAPLASFVPLAALAGILLFVAWNMFEGHQFARLRLLPPSHRALMLGTFVLTIVFDLTVAVQVGLVLACVFFIWRMGQLFSVKPVAAAALPAGVMAFELYGSLFFGAVGRVESLPDELQGHPRAVVLDLSRLVLVDSSGLDALEQMALALRRRGITLVLAHVNDEPLALMQRSGFAALVGAEHIAPDLHTALLRLHTH